MKIQSTNPHPFKATIMKKEFCSGRVFENNENRITWSSIHSSALSVGIYRFPLLKHLVVEQFHQSVSNNPTNPFPISNILSRSRPPAPHAPQGARELQFWHLESNLLSTMAVLGCALSHNGGGTQCVHREVETGRGRTSRLCGVDRPANSNIVLGGESNVHFALCIAYWMLAGTFYT